MEAASLIYRAPILKWLQALHDGKCREDYRVGAMPQGLTVHKYLLLMNEDIQSENQVCGLGQITLFLIKTPSVRWVNGFLSL